jgi:chromosome segregation ATPase
MASSSAERLNEISTELAGILETRIQELTSAMKSAETTTRQIVATEMEIARYTQIVDTLGSEVGGLQKEAAAMRRKAEDARSGYTAAMADRDAARSDLNRLDEQADELRRETTELRARAKALEESVSRMRKLRDDTLGAVGGLDQQLAGMGLGGKQ